MLIIKDRYCMWIVAVDNLWSIYIYCKRGFVGYQNYNYFYCIRFAASRLYSSLKFQ